MGGGGRLHIRAWGQAGGREVFSTFPQTELPKGLGWRDDGTYPQMGPQLKQWAEPWSHGN